MPEPTEPATTRRDVSADRRNERTRTLEGVLLVGAIVLAAMLLVSPIVGLAFMTSLGVYGPGLVLHLAHLFWVRRAPGRAVAISHCLTYFGWMTAVLALHVG